MTSLQWVIYSATGVFMFVLWLLANRALRNAERAALRAEMAKDRAEDTYRRMIIATRYMAQTTPPPSPGA